MLGIWPYAMYICLSKFLQNQRIVYPSMIVGIIGIIINIPFNMIFIWAFKMSTTGTNLSIFLCVTFVLVFLLKKTIIQRVIFT